jgi:hypothetical protein
MDHLAARALYDPAHNVDGRIVPIKKAGRGHNSDLILRLVWRYFLHLQILYREFTISRIASRMK